MSRFRRLSDTEVAGLLRHAQEVSSGVQMGCPKCRQWFRQDDVQKTRSGRIVPGGYAITCPLCGGESAARHFSYQYPEQASDIGRGVRLDNNEIAHRVHLTPGPGITTISSCFVMVVPICPYGKKVGDSGVLDVDRWVAGQDVVALDLPQVPLVVF